LLINHHSNAHTAVIKNGYKKKEKKRKEKKVGGTREAMCTPCVYACQVKENRPTEASRMPEMRKENDAHTRKRDIDPKKKKEKREKEIEETKEKKKRKKLVEYYVG
jgi:predicted ATP-binding protein involved in virulence